MFYNIRLFQFTLDFQLIMIFFLIFSVLLILYFKIILAFIEPFLLKILVGNFAHAI